MSLNRRLDHPADSEAYFLQVHRASGDTWHSFANMQEAASFALDILRSVVDGKTYPLAIWHHDKKLWRPFGRHGKLHVAPTRDALESLLRGER